MSNTMFIMLVAMMCSMLAWYVLALALFLRLKRTSIGQFELLALAFNRGGRNFNDRVANALADMMMVAFSAFFLLWVGGLFLGFS